MFAKIKRAREQQEENEKRNLLGSRTKRNWKVEESQEKHPSLMYYNI
jgi:hypothetical protein